MTHPNALAVLHRIRNAPPPAPAGERCEMCGQQVGDEAAHAAGDVLRLDPQFRVADWAAYRPYADAAVVAALSADMQAAGLG